MGIAKVASVIFLLTFLAGCSPDMKRDLTVELEHFFLGDLGRGDMVHSLEYQALLETHRDVDRVANNFQTDDMELLYLDTCGTHYRVSSGESADVALMDHLAYMQVTLEKFGYPNEVIQTVFGQIQLPANDSQDFSLIGPDGVVLIDLAENLGDTWIYSIEGKKNLYLLETPDITYEIVSAFNYLAHKLELGVPNTSVYTACGGPGAAVQLSSTPADAKMSYITKFRHLYCQKLGVDADNSEVCDYWDDVSNGGVIYGILGRIVVSAKWNDGNREIASYNLQHLGSPLGSSSGGCDAAPEVHAVDCIKINVKR